MNEIWKQIKDFPDYEISNFGRVKSLKFGSVRIMRSRINSKGYDLCNLCGAGGIKSRQVHNLVAEHFIGECSEGFVVNHKDGNKLNNHVSNLEYVSVRDNRLHGLNTKETSSKYAGVYWLKDKNKFRAQITIKGNRISLGLFSSEVDAHKAYLNALENHNIYSKYAE